MTRWLRFAFFLLIVRPVVFFLLGLNVRNYQRLPAQGPAIIVANHNSHLDTMVLMSLLPLRLLDRIHPVAAADYFLRNRLLAWFATGIIGIIPIARTGGGGNPLAGCFEALREGEILIMFPEGSRGEPEQMKENFKQGVRVIARKFPEAPVYPVFLHGLGKALPKGEGLFVPFFCDVFVGEALEYQSVSQPFVDEIRISLNALAEEGEFPAWD